MVSIITEHHDQGRILVLSRDLIGAARVPHGVAATIDCNDCA